MHLDPNATRLAVDDLLSTEVFAERIAYGLGRPLSEPERQELVAQLETALYEVLGDFVFDMAEAEPQLDQHVIWADEHKGIGFRRPKGHVIYTVTGRASWFRRGLIAGYNGIEVHRSSDGELQPMTIAELERMVES